MIRTDNEYLEVHFGGGQQLSNCLIDSDKVYKLAFDADGCEVTDLTNNNTYTIYDSSDRGMSTYMMSFVGGCSYPGTQDGYEYALDRFYGIAGISRATTSEEDYSIKQILLTQEV